MIILVERKLTPKSDIKDPKEVVKFLDLMWSTFEEIRSSLAKLSIVFLDTTCLKEGQKETLDAYQKAAQEIRAKLTELSMMNSTLTRFLASETRPIPINPNATIYFDRKIDEIGKALKLYYKEVKGTYFPRFDNEVKQLKDIAVQLNANIDRINEINSAYTPRVILAHVKNLKI